ncbi:MAG: ribosome small subunit-dependent GTPase A [Spirochaeta sp.]
MNNAPDSWVTGRVIARFPGSCEVTLPSAAEPVRARISGSFRYRAVSAADYPVVGDQVMLSDHGTVIQQVLPRKSLLSRQSAGKTVTEQALAANVDLVLLIFGLDGFRNFSDGLLERLLTLVYASGASPAIILNKADQAVPEHTMSITARIGYLAPGIPIVITSAAEGTGVQEAGALISTGKTACCIGRSGVGKSSLINRLIEQNSAVIGKVREFDHKGRHTTTTSRLYTLSNGGMIIDSPGLREIQLWGDESALDDNFADVAGFAADCKFRDCTHRSEPGCAVQKAVSEGILPLSRFEHYLEQRKEMNLQ